MKQDVRILFMDFQLIKFAISRNILEFQLVVSHIKEHKKTYEKKRLWRIVAPTSIQRSKSMSPAFRLNKAKAISAELLELSFKNKLEETGKTR